jgi:cytochrome c biogenesis protein CcmG/thiol:disulfide interchange protein DsbE
MSQRIVLGIILSCLAGPSIAVEAGEMAPAWTASDFSGNEIEFPAATSGKPTIMVFWATWCPYCNAFMPYLSRIQKDYGEDKITVLAINHKERGVGDPAAYVAKLDFSVVAIREGDSIGDTYSVDFIPGLMIIDGDGKIAWKRASTDLPAGKTVAELWDEQVREQLDLLL